MPHAIDNYLMFISIVILVHKSLSQTVSVVWIKVWKNFISGHLINNIIQGGGQASDTVYKESYTCIFIVEVLNIKENIFPYVLHQLHKVWTQLDGLKLNKIDFSLFCIISH